MSKFAQQSYTNASFLYETFTTQNLVIMFAWKALPEVTAQRQEKH